MPDVTKSLEVAASPESVWAVVTDFERFGEWNTIHRGFPDGVPRAEEGSEYVEAVALMGMPIEAEWTVTEVDPPHRFASEGKAPMGVRIRSRLELVPHGEGTVVTLGGSFRGRRVLIGPVAKRFTKEMAQASDESLEKLRSLVTPDCG